MASTAMLVLHGRELARRQLGNWLLSSLILLILVLACGNGGKVAVPFDEAQNAMMTRDQRRVRDLYVKAAESDADPRRRDQARIRAARIDWYVLHDPAAARVALARVPETSAEIFAAHAERSRLECELIHDFGAARMAAELAHAAAKTQMERDQALTRAAAATVEEARLRREAGRCPEREPLSEAIEKLRTAIQGSGPTRERMQLVLDAALLARDDGAALQAWRWYYAGLPSLVPPSFDDRRAAGLALASARLYLQADMVLRDPCAPNPIVADAAVQDVLAYAASLRRVGALAAEHHRSVAAGTSNDKAFERALGAEGASLWRALSWPGQPPTFSLEALQRELSTRFGAVITLGKTEGIFTLLYGHRVADETRVVEQHGHRGSLHFVQLDGIISGGYAAWATHGETGTGGWIGSDAMYQVRPMYIDGPLRLWYSISDPAARARAETEIRVETDRDRERAKGDAIVALSGLAMRLRQQYGDRLREQLASDGLEGHALRDAFLGAASADKLASSIWAHEGRHSIDKALGISSDVELEFRAKLSEVVFAPMPRGSLGSILAPMGGKGAHAVANERVMKGVAAWMRTHAAKIAGLEPSAPLLPQLDRLTDDQLREAFRSLDPLAR